MKPKASLPEMPGHLIRQLNQHSTAVFQCQLKAAGYDVTSVQFAALQTLHDHPNIDQATLASLIAYDRATIGGVVKRLEQKDLIQRQPNKDDRRAFKLSLTPLGGTLLADTAPIVAALQNDILCRLTGSERHFLVELIQKALHLDAAPESLT